ncbi:DEAD/DEAH box helicase [Sanguibacter antarcticus]|uniref:DEAD/DEAH box helicase domain-containing protein n=1 Tax=Sanguibacter antarcticus TaxID=372484 RepID=A0A2A9E8J2_9MICO|nr:DEAD/DEAH box helicase [Sanguibacter antarcticus]PFG35184.1 DEAD/DEAH box helicase domain-containing protein [Sanguibacter antarcticus]
MARVDELLTVLLAGGRREDRLTHVENLPARPGTQGDWPAWADPSLVAGYRSMGVELPWLHQVEAADSAWGRTHTILATSTGSGKSLAFWLPALSAVRGDRADEAFDPGRIESARNRGSVLYLSPTKALAADQLSSVTGLLRASGIRDVQVDTCDGDTPFDARRWIQDHADVILTNPDYLHFSLLPNHARWARFLRSLRYVVIDEGHAFRGIFGAHVSLVLRRLQRLAEHYAPDSRTAAGSRSGPTFVVASATTADPATSAARLIGVDPSQVRAVTADASPAGRKTFALWEPPEIPPVRGEMTTRRRLAGDEAASAFGIDEHGDDGLGLVDDADPVDASGDPRPRRSATAEAADLLADLTAHGARTLAFTRSRRGAESVATTTQDHLRPVDPSLPGRVAAYRGGYLPEERRALEAAVRSGEIRALATTNALELGVDISGLDAVLIIGWPGTRVSLWQQAGRAGRAGSDGLVAFIAREDPLDTYLVHNPDAIFRTPIEATVFDPTNPYVLAGHLCAAAAELPVREADLPLFGGAGARTLLDQLTARGTLRHRTSGWYWTHHQGAAGFTNIRGEGGTPVAVVESSTGRLLGTVDAAAADGSVHEGAVYVHQGQSFVVEEYNLRDSVALVARETVSYTTWSRWVTSIAVVEEVEHVGWGDRAEPAGPTVDAPATDGRPPVEWGFGSVEVSTQVVTFQRRRVPGQEVLSTDPLDLPVRTLQTAAAWWSVSAELLESAGVDADDAPGALHAAEHASIGLLPLLATCDRWDLGGVSTAIHVDTERATVFVYDAFPGGAGFAERGYRLAETWLSATRDAIVGCACSDGCPGCVQSPKCGNGNNPLDKAAAVRLLDAVLAHAPITGSPGSDASPMGR